MSLPKHSLLLALPRVSPADLVDSESLPMLRRGKVRRTSESVEVLDRILGLLNRDALGEGRAALRYLGQTGAAPAAWIAAADPVHMETCIDHIRIHALPPAAVSPADLEVSFERLQKALGHDPDEQAETVDALAFRTVGETGYIESRAAPLETPQVSGLAVNGREPSPFMPDGTDGDGGQRFHRLHSEVQMVFHDASLLAAHPERGNVAVNGLWIWGGGRLPVVSDSELPALFSDDDLVSGYWRAAGAEPKTLPDDLRDCVTSGGAPFVVVSVRRDPNAVQQAIDLLKAGELSRLALLLEGDLVVELSRADRFRFWRRPDPALDVSRELG